MKNFEQVCRLVRQGLDDGAYPSACLSVGIRGSVCVRQTFGPAGRLRCTTSPACQRS
ncbi:MAG: hypothetical protein ACLRRT_05470 [Ruthenibacterium lactatiformans]